MDGQTAQAGSLYPGGHSRANSAREGEAEGQSGSSEYDAFVSDWCVPGKGLRGRILTILHYTSFEALFQARQAYFSKSAVSWGTSSIVT